MVTTSPQPSGTATTTFQRPKPSASCRTQACPPASVSAMAIDYLARIASAEHAEEIIVMTRPHVVAEFLHLDWASKARRRLGVPVLHLIEHEPLDAEAGTGQGITGM